MGSQIFGAFMVLAAACLWSLAGFIIKSTEMSSTWIIFIRCIFGGAVLSPFLFTKKIKPLRKMFISGFCIAMFLFSFTYTTRIGSPSMAVSMQLTCFLFVILLNIIKYRKIEPLRFVAFILICIGVYFNITFALKTASPIAIFTGFGVGLFFALYAVFVKQVSEGSALGIVSGTTLTAAVFSAFILPFDFTPVPNSINDILLVAVAGVLISGVSYVLYGIGLKRLDLEVALLITFAEPVLNPVWIYIAKGEIPALNSLIALIFILFGAILNVLVIYYNKRKYRPRTTNGGAEANEEMEA